MIATLPTPISLPEEAIPWIILLAVGLVLILLIALIRALARQRIRYISRKSLFTETEARFHEGLRDILPEDRLLFAKVRLADLITPEKHPDRSLWQSAFNRVSSKHVDFVITDSGGRILGIIELDDRSHQRRDRIERDAFVDDALTAAGLPILHVPTAKSYDWKTLLRSIVAFMPKEL